MVYAVLHTVIHRLPHPTPLYPTIPAPLPSSRLLFDSVGGVEDCQARQLRTICPPAESFVTDPARILRGVRLAARASELLRGDVLLWSGVLMRWHCLGQRPLMLLPVPAWLTAADHIP